MVRSRSEGETDMAQLNVRLPDALYEEVQSILKSHLKMDLSEFVREIFVDMILIYSKPGDQVKALALAGERHRMDTNPGMILMLGRDWEDLQDWRQKETTRVLTEDGSIPPPLTPELEE